MDLMTFGRMFIEDSLAFDQAVFEVVPDKAGRPSYIVPVDSTTIRLIDPGVRDPGDPFAVQVINGSILTDFTPDELAFCVRNPRSGIKSYGYGLSEIETLVREITGFLWGMEYNRRFFTQGSAAKGILNFKGLIPRPQLRAFRRQWYSMVSGVSNAWRTPITNADELQWINMQLTNRDMEYSQWMDFLIKIVCARFQIAPEEVNFSYGNTNQNATMGGTNTEEKLAASRDLGLRPLVQWFFRMLNRHFLQKIDPEFEVVPVGLDASGESAETELLTKQVSSFITVDEARQRRNMEPLGEDMGGDLVLNPQWIQWYTTKQGMDMMNGPGDDENDEGGELDFPDPDGPDEFEIGGDDDDEGMGGGDVDQPQDAALKSQRRTAEPLASYTVPITRR